MSPLADVLVQPSDAAGVARHVYEFADGTTEYVALYQGGNADAGAEVAIPRGAKITDVTMTLSGASATVGPRLSTTTALIGCKGSLRLLMPVLVI